MPSHAPLCILQRPLDLFILPIGLATMDYGLLWSPLPWLSYGGVHYFETLEKKNENQGTPGYDANAASKVVPDCLILFL